MVQGELHTATTVGPPSVTLNERRKRLKTVFRKIRRSSATRVNRPNQTPRLTHDVEPIDLSQRAVFRSQGELPVETVVGLHEYIRSGSAIATETLSIIADGEPTAIPNSGFHSAIRHVFEENLKTTAQLTGIYPPDPELTRPTQELFEQFFQVHGLPNEAESILLQAVGYVDAETVEAWFTMKVFRLRGYLTLVRTIKEQMLRAFDGKAFWRDPPVSRPRLLKPYSRH